MTLRVLSAADIAEIEQELETHEEPQPEPVVETTPFMQMEAALVESEHVILGATERMFREILDVQPPSNLENDFSEAVEQMLMSIRRLRYLSFYVRGAMDGG